MKLTPFIAKSLAPTTILFLSSPNLGTAAMAMATKDHLVRDRAVGKFGIPVEEIVELCPNPDFQAIDDSVPCLNYSDPATPKSYGQRDTCSKFGYLGNPRLAAFASTWATAISSMCTNVEGICRPWDGVVSLEGSPLHVGSPQGVSSVRIYGNLNCTLYKYVLFSSPRIPISILRTLPARPQSSTSEGGEHTTRQP